MENKKADLQEHGSFPLEGKSEARGEGEDLSFDQLKLEETQVKVLQPPPPPPPPARASSPLASSPLASSSSPPPPLSPDLLVRCCKSGETAGRRKVGSGSSRWRCLQETSLLRLRLTWWDTAKGCTNPYLLAFFALRHHLHSSFTFSTPWSGVLAACRSHLVADSRVLGVTLHDLAGSCR
eukprot:768705-Hanusia_phi.AAC.5